MLPNLFQEMVSLASLTYLIRIGRISSPVHGEIALLDGFERPMEDGRADAVEP